MSDEEPLNAAERELEAALGALHPGPAAIDRDRLMFEAGRRSVGPQHGRPIAWQMISGALAAALLVSVFLHRAPRDVERVVRVPAEAKTTTTAPEQIETTLAAATPALNDDASIDSKPPPTSYLILRRHALSADETRNAAEGRLGVTRAFTRGESEPDLPADAGFFGRARKTSGERL